MKKKVPVKRASGAAAKAKSIGLPSLDYVAQKTNKSRSTLDRWYRENPDFFDIILQGCLVTYDKKYQAIVNILKG